jgi:hypothetical protein
MNLVQSLKKRNSIERASGEQRLYALVIFLFFSGVFVVLLLASRGVIDLSIILPPCGFKQKWHLPCPTCGVTTSAKAFVSGDLFESFYIQPFGFLLCLTGTITAFLSFLIFVFGVYFKFLENLRKIRVSYWLVITGILIAAGWAVTLIRAVIERY